MIETCPICGRYSLSRDYPPKPCPICEEEPLASIVTPLESCSILAPRQPPAPMPPCRN
jgi:hypothetical protein